ncbi:Crp/Fnr family transcriptional regulator [Rhizobium sp. L18]|uniref:Crp/Fnr family transcriptional regulator n=1 Tax=Rhizobium sp. L18 TaxID=2035451 RepID=UPI0015CEF525|nr:Crp/Fnr family transcriptional regulator [Rhizobium sp. L18]
MSNETAKDFLRETDWLKKAPISFQDAVLARGYFASFAAGKVICDIGDPPGGMMGVVKGHVAVSAVTQEGFPRLGHIMRAGDWFGVAAILVREPRRIRVVAQVPLQMFVLPLREIDAIIDAPSTRSDAWRHFARIILSNQDVSVGASRDLLIRDSKVRCFAVLLRLGGFRRGRSLAEAEPELDLAQEELAHLANLSRNAIGTILRELQRTKVIEIAYKRLKILKPAVLIGQVIEYERNHP